MEPSSKSITMENFLTKMSGVDRYGAILANRCTWCGSEISDFRNEISKIEYKISGFCQSCQDSVFGRD